MSDPRSMAIARPDWKVANTYNLSMTDHRTGVDALDEARRRNPECEARWVQLSKSGKYWTVTELEPAA